VDEGKTSTTHMVPQATAQKAFKVLKSELEAKSGTRVNLDEQYLAALHVCYQTGNHAFVEGWAGTGKTTMLKALNNIYKQEGFSLVGCALSGSASLNLEQETGIKSSTLASLLLSIQEERIKLTSRDVVILDEAGLVDSRKFALLQDLVVKAGAKLVAIGDSKQLQPIEAGGIFKALTRIHGSAQVSKIQRQRTDWAPFLDYLQTKAKNHLPLELQERANALASLSENERTQALQALVEESPFFARVHERWIKRYDHQWLRSAVEQFAKGKAEEALALMQEHECLHLISDSTKAYEALISDWFSHKAKVSDKAIIAATRADVAKLNELARGKLLEAGRLDQSQGIHVQVQHQDGSTSHKHFVLGDRIVFTKNDSKLGSTNGSLGTLVEIKSGALRPELVVKLDKANKAGVTLISVPADFGHLDHGYCLTNHKAQGKTVEASFVFVDPRYLDREWIYVASSRSKHATHLYVDEAPLHPKDQEEHIKSKAPAPSPLEQLARQMNRSRIKGTTLDYSLQNPDIRPTELKKAKAFFQRLLGRKDKHNNKETTHELEHQRS